MKIKTALQAAGLKKVYDYIDKDPHARLPQVISLIEKFVPSGSSIDGTIKGIKEGLSDPGNNWNRFVMNLWDDVDDGARRAVFENFAVNGTFLETDVNESLQEKYDCNIPWTMLIDPTSACNLHCTGCWAAEYGSKLNLSYEELDGIIRQGKELGIHFFLYSGGEPLVRKADLLRLCEAHPDCEFSAFTNGTLIDEAFADEMLRVKNFIPAISVEGFEAATDARRGAGTFKRVERAMAILKQRRLPFGISCCYTSQNLDSISSEAFIDDMVARGAKFAWYFHYMPVGNDAVPELLPTPQQREKMVERIRGFRETKPIFALDFQNDGEFVKGCIAGGRRYLHINANGDMEPCAFIHYSDSSVYDKTLLEALKSPLFMAYHDGQPFNDNMLRPCPMLENPEKLRDMVKKSGAKSTDMQSPEDVDNLYGKCKPYADKWTPTADHLWSCSHSCASCQSCPSAGQK